MDIRLNQLAEKHFKGITSFTLRINGKNASVFGDNGVGKTTQFDAFLWLLFGKDSTDRSAFKLKPQDDQGNDIHNLQTEAEAELCLDSRTIKLRKMQEEKWTKKRGTENPELTGNTISYWWNEVPVKESEYKQKISELIDESIFRMITNPMYFNTKVAWQDRRKILLEICGDLSDAEVIASNNKLSKLTEILTNRTIEDYKKILAEKLKGLEKERENIRPRIDELMLQVPQVQPDYSGTEAELENYLLMMTGIEKELSDATSTATALRKKQQDLYGLKGKLETVKARIDAEAGAGTRKLIEERGGLGNEKYRLESDISLIKSRIEHNACAIESNSKEREKLIAEWNRLNADRQKLITDKFVEPDEDNFVCPTCGQSLPEDAREAKLEDMRLKFEANKKSQTENIEGYIKENKNTGIALNINTETLKKANEEYQSAITKTETRVIEIVSRLSEIEQLLSQDIAVSDYNSNPEYVSLQKQIEDLQTELNKPIEDTTSSLLQNKREIQGKIDACKKILNSKESTENTLRRIDQLKDDEKRISTQIAELEGHKYLLEQFVVTKVNLLESNINSRFKYVRFKMFNQQVNGGIEECCEAMVNTNGSYVPFSEANHAGKVNAGLDIINTLCAYYGVTAPIFIDFRESVSRIIDTSSQVINLIKNEPDKVLRVEVEG